MKKVLAFLFFVPHSHFPSTIILKIDHVESHPFCRQWHTMLQTAQHCHFQSQEKAEEIKKRKENR